MESIVINFRSAVESGEYSALVDFKRTDANEKGMEEDFRPIQVVSINDRIVAFSVMPSDAGKLGEICILHISERSEGETIEGEFYKAFGMAVAAFRPGSVFYGLDNRRKLHSELHDRFAGSEYGWYEEIIEKAHKMLAKLRLLGLM